MSRYRIEQKGEEIRVRGFSRAFIQEAKSHGAIFDGDGDKAWVFTNMTRDKVSELAESCFGETEIEGLKNDKNSLEMELSEVTQKLSNLMQKEIASSEPEDLRPDDGPKFGFGD